MWAGPNGVISLSPVAASDADLKSGAGRVATTAAKRGHQVPPVTQEVASNGPLGLGTGSSLGNCENQAGGGLVWA